MPKVSPLVGPLPELAGPAQRDTMVERRTPGRRGWMRTKITLGFHLWANSPPRCSWWVLNLSSPMPSCPAPYILLRNFHLLNYTLAASCLKLRSNWRGWVAPRGSFRRVPVPFPLETHAGKGPRRVSLSNKRRVSRRGYRIPQLRQFLRARLEPARTHGSVRGAQLPRGLEGE